MSKENHKRPSFQFYPSDWLSDPNTNAMTAEEEGAYIRILCYMWNTEDGSLRNDEEYLARLGRVDKVVIGSLYPCFKVVNGALRHKRLDYERNKQDNYREICSKAGKKGMEKRWKKAVKNKVVITDYNSSSSSSSTTSSSTTSSERESTPAQKMMDFVKSVREKNNSYISLVEKMSNNNNFQAQMISAELDKFVSYWTELNKSGTRERWETERTFEVQKRLATWFSRVGGYVGKKVRTGTIIS